MRLTGSVKAAENYMKYFEKELEIKMHCSYKEEAGVKSNNTIRMYNQLVKNGLVFLIVEVHSLFTEPMFHP